MIRRGDMEKLLLSTVDYKAALRSLVLSVALVASACREGGEPYTLYRSSAIKEHVRIHVATFDADAGSHYNKDNCEIARELFQIQPGVTVRYWCEQGRYRP